MWFAYVVLIAIFAGLVAGPLLQRSFDGESIKIGGIIALVFLVICSAGYGIARVSTLADTEILNGEVTAKERINDSHLRYYQCNCGKDGCSTCSETIYTVDWWAHTNIKSIKIAEKDSHFSSVWNTPNPPFYDMIKKGDPVAVEHYYANYIKAAPESLWKPAAEAVKKQYAAKIPKYPSDVYMHYNLDRVLPVDVSIPNLNEWNRGVADMLKVLGPQKQANVVVVVTSITDPMYVQALRDSWVGGKKNDVIVVISAPEFPKKAEWVEVISLSEDEMLHASLRDDLQDLDTITPAAALPIIQKNVLEHFKRKPMKKFDYLMSDINIMPIWAMILTLAIAVAVSAVLVRNNQTFYRIGRGRSYYAGRRR